MKKKQKNIQIALVSIGLLLILITYFYYPYLQKNKISNTTESQNDLLKDDEKIKILHLKTSSIKAFMILTKHSL